MRRGNLFLVHKASTNDPKSRRVFVVVSRPVLIESRHSTVICAPIFSNNGGLATQVAVGAEEGLKHPSAIHCDELMSVLKTRLTSYVGTLSVRKLEELNRALLVALHLDSRGTLP